MIALARLNELSQAEFRDALADIFEHSPWVPERAWSQRPFAGVDDLHGALCAVLAKAGDDERLRLIRAHPELAGKAAIDRTLTAESTAEQASAGLDRLTEAEFERFHALNAAYRARFGFPFVICVRLTDKAGILAAMEQRLGHDRTGELATALTEVGKIVKLRLEDVL